MMCSIAGMFANIKATLKLRDRYAGLARHGLDELHRNLRYLKREHAAGRGEAALTEFFAAYVVEDTE